MIKYFCDKCEKPIHGENQYIQNDKALTKNVLLRGVYNITIGVFMSTDKDILLCKKCAQELIEKHIW